MSAPVKSCRRNKIFVFGPSLFSDYNITALKLSDRLVGVIVVSRDLCISEKSPIFRSLHKFELTYINPTAKGFP